MYRKRNNNNKNIVACSHLSARLAWTETFYPSLGLAQPDFHGFSLEGLSPSKLQGKSLGNKVVVIIWMIDDSPQLSRMFIRSLVKSRDNWTPAQNRRLDRVGVGGFLRLGRFRLAFPPSPSIQVSVFVSKFKSDVYL